MTCSAPATVPCPLDELYLLHIVNQSNPSSLKCVLSGATSQQQEKSRITGSFVCVLNTGCHMLRSLNSVCFFYLLAICFVSRNCLAVKTKDVPTLSAIYLWDNDTLCHYYKLKIGVLFLYPFFVPFFLRQSLLYPVWSLTCCLV